MGHFYVYFQQIRIVESKVDTVTVFLRIGMEKNMFHLGVDGGGTKTTAILCDEQGSVLRSVRMGPGNISVLDRGSVAQLIRNILYELLAGEGLDKIQWATFAFAGAGRPEEKKTVRDLIKTAGLHQFTVMSDAEILYFSIFADQPGILISAGTGSICLLRTAKGKFQQIGGWGYLLDDEGSGFDIGRTAIRFVLQELVEKNTPSDFSKKLLLFYGLENPADLISIIYSSINPPNLVASCARLVCDLAQQNDPVADQVLSQALDSLIGFVRQAIDFFKKYDETVDQAALAGGILHDNAYVNRRFKQRMKQSGLNFTYARQEYEPAAAGVLYSMQKTGVQPSSLFLEKLKNIKI
jgi:N-acetylglucosamine kinase-like BadF-type ATPase